MASAGSPFTDEQILDRLATNEIAGGDAYINQLPAEQIPARSKADVIITSTDTPRDLFDATNAYDFVWVDGDVDMDLTDWSGAISNCTLASDRGQAGSEGARLWTSSAGEDSTSWAGGGGTGFLRFHDDVRLFGIRLRGPTWDYWKDDAGNPHPEHPGYIPFHFDTMTRSERDAFRRSLYSRGIAVYGERVEIENCEIHGFSTQGISVGTTNRAGTLRPDIHHCHLHDNMQSGLGYNVNTYRGIPRIRFCYLNASRHSVATFGYWNSGYRIEDSVIGPATSSFLLDTHNLQENSSGSTSNRYNKDFYGRASGYLKVRRNTFTPHSVIEEADFNAGNRTRHISFGGEPWPVDGDGAIIENNAFIHDTFSRAFFQKTSGDGWSVPSSGGTTANVTVRDNQYAFNTKAYDPNYGAPVDLLSTAPEHTLSFEVTDVATGAKIEGAEITVTKDASEWFRTTDVDGRASISALPAATYDIAIVTAGYETVRDSVLLDGDKTKTYALATSEETVSVTFEVVDATDGTPIQGADVSVWEF